MAEPAQRREAADGSKYYEHPTRTEPDPERPGSYRFVRYVSVTTALDVVNKDALKYWAAGLAAERAMANLPQLMVAAFKPDCGRAYARTEPLGCGDCEACTRRWVSLFHVGESARRAREGSAAHDVWEGWARTGELIYTPVLSGDPDVDQYVPTQQTMAPYIAALRAFVTDFGLQPGDIIVTECTVYHHGLLYAGTLDTILDLHPRTKKAAEVCARVGLAAGVPAGEPVRLLVDLKSREGEKAQLYDEQPLQLTGYRFAETMMPKAHLQPSADLEIPMMATDGAAILQVRPDGYTFRPVVTDGRTRKAFEAVLTLSRWRETHGERSTQVQAFPLPDGWTWAPPAVEGAAPARKRAPRKTAKKAAAPAITDPIPPDTVSTPARQGAIMASLLTGGGAPDLDEVPPF